MPNWANLGSNVGEGIGQFMNDQRAMDMWKKQQAVEAAQKEEELRLTAGYKTLQDWAISGSGPQGAAAFTKLTGQPVLPGMQAPGEVPQGTPLQSPEQRYKGPQDYKSEMARAELELDAAKLKEREKYNEAYLKILGDRIKQSVTKGEADELSKLYAEIDSQVAKGMFTKEQGAEKAQQMEKLYYLKKGIPYDESVVPVGWMQQNLPQWFPATGKKITPQGGATKTGGNTSASYSGSVNNAPGAMKSPSSPTQGETGRQRNIREKALKQGFKLSDIIKSPVYQEAGR